MLNQFSFKQDPIKEFDSQCKGTYNSEFFPYECKRNIHSAIFNYSNKSRIVFKQDVKQHLVS